MTPIEYKRGTAFGFAGLLKDADGNGVPLDDYTIEAGVSQWRQNKVGARIGAVDVEKLVTTGAFYLFLEDVTDSAAWALGPAALDVVLTPPGGPRQATKGYVLLQIVETATPEVAP